jgi:hypothetical protein
MSGGSGQIEAVWRTGIDGGLRAVKLATLTLTQRNDLALELGRCRIEPDRGGGPTSRG